MNNHFLIIILSTCITLLSSCLVQKNVFVTSNDSGTIIHINGDQVGFDSTYVDLDRDLKLKKVIITKEGHKSRKGIIFQFNAGLDMRYKLEYRFAPPVLTPTKKEDLKDLLVTSTSVRIKKGDIIGTNYYGTYYKNGIDILSNESIKYENTMLTADLNNYLTQINYTDTSYSVIPNNLNSVFLKASIDSYHISTVHQTHKGNFKFSYLDLDMTWTFEDIYGKELLTVHTTEKSDAFSSSEEFKTLVNDALEYSVIKLLSKNEVTEILKPNDNEKNTNMDLEKITLLRPETSSSINNSIASCVTVKIDNGHGSGFIISSDGYIITNYHVVAQSNNIEIIFSDGSNLSGTLERYDPLNDLALIKTAPISYPPLLLSDSKEVPLGVDVLAIGTPENTQLGQSISKGIVSGKRESNNTTYIQTDVSINKGNSGGPLVLEGTVLGIINSKVFGLGVEGIGFAIPAHYVFSRLNIEYNTEK